MEEARRRKGGRLKRPDRIEEAEVRRVRAGRVRGALDNETK